MSMRAMPIGRTSVTATLDLLGEIADERAVVERFRQRVAAGRLEEGLRLAREPRLRRPEHQEQQPRRDDAGRQRDDDDLAPHRFEPLDDRHGVAPDADHAEDLAIDAEWQELAQQCRRGERRRDRRLPRWPARWPPAAFRPSARPNSAVPGAATPLIPGSLAATIVPSARRSSTRRISPARGSVASCASSRSISVAAGDRVEREVVRRDVGVDERADRRRVAPDQPGQGRGREMGS